MTTFTAHCARDHDRIDFTDPATFEQHMTTEHKARKRTPGHTAFGWTEAGRIGKPWPWRAPKAPTTTDKLTAVLLEASCRGGKYGVRGYPGDHLDPDWHTDDHIPPADLVPGDVFVLAAAPGVRYIVRDTDPEKGWELERVGDHAQAGSARRAWLRELKLPRSGPVGTVVRVGRAA